MCVLASAVDIFSSHPLRGGDWLPSWSPPRFVLALPAFDALAHQYSWCDMYVCDKLASSLKDMLTSAVLSSCLLIFPFP